MLATEAEWFEQRLAAVETALHAKLDDIFGRRHHTACNSETWETTVQHLDDLIALGQTLKAERATLLADRDAEKVRADKAEGDLAALQSQVAADESKAAAAAADLQAEVTAETSASDPSAPITAVVTAPTPAQSTTIPVAQVVVGDIATAVNIATTAGSSVSVTGDNLSPGTTVTSVDPTASTITLSAPTTDAHVGDGTEQLVVTPAAS